MLSSDILLIALTRHSPYGVRAQCRIAVFFLSREDEIGKGFGQRCAGGVLDEDAGVGREDGGCCEASEHGAGHGVSV